MIDNFEFNLKTKTKFGEGVALNLSQYLKELKFKKIGVIVDSGVIDVDYIKEILENLKKENLETIKIWRYNLGGEPDYDSLDKIKLEFLDKSFKPVVDCFVGIGGGSVIDFAKGLATLVVNSGESRKYRGFPVDINPSLPTIALPTTAGTASEVTYNAVFIDWGEKKKLGINTMHNFPILAILDPKLTLSCPKLVTVSSGMDALTHALESYVATKSNYLTRIFAKEAFKLVFNNLKKVLDNPENLEIRAGLQLGAYLAGISLMNSGSGPAGALSYILGTNFKVPHGLASAIFLPYIVEHNIQNGYDYGDLYELIEGANKNLSSKENKSQEFCKEIFKLSRKLDVPPNLKEVGVNENNLKILLKNVENLGPAFSQNPILFSIDDGKKLLTKLIK